MAFDMQAEQLLLQCEWQKAKHPVMHLMPMWDELGQEWLLNSDEMGNAHFRDRFHFWSSLENKATYALYWSEGFFFPGNKVYAAGMQIDSDYFDLMDAEEEEEDEENMLHISGYCWEQDGTTHLLSNRDDNESWADTDDWIFGAFFFSDYMPDGSLIPPCPPGYCRSWEKDADGNTFPGCRKLPESLEVDKSLLQLGFNRAPRRPGSEEAKLEEMYEKS